MFEKIRDIICEQLGVDAADITSETDFMLDLKCDSLELIEIMIEMENEFGLDSIPEDDMTALKTVGDLAAYISKKVNG